jgi:hypothetical protein
VTIRREVRFAPVTPLVTGQVRPPEANRDLAIAAGSPKPAADGSFAVVMPKGKVVIFQIFTDKEAVQQRGKNRLLRRLLGKRFPPRGPRQ